MINFTSDTLKESQKEKLRKLPLEKKLEVITSLELSFPILLDYLIERLEKAILLREISPLYTQAIITWKNTIEHLKRARNLFEK